MVISVDPTLATVERPKPRKMSPMPQIAKLTAIRPSTTPMTALPSQLLEALRIPRSIVVLHRVVDESAGVTAGSRKGAHHRDEQPAPQQAAGVPKDDAYDANLPVCQPPGQPA